MTHTLQCQQSWTFFPLSRIFCALVHSRSKIRQHCYKIIAKLHHIAEESQHISFHQVSDLNENEIGIVLGNQASECLYEIPGSG